MEGVIETFASGVLVKVLQCPLHTGQHTLHQSAPLLVAMATQKHKHTAPFLNRQDKGTRPLANQRHSNGGRIRGGVQSAPIPVLEVGKS